MRCITSILFVSLLISGNIFSSFGAPSLKECPKLWKRYPDFSMEKAKQIYNASPVDQIEGIWEDGSGVKLLITKSADNNCEVAYVMLVIKDLNYYGNWHRLLPPGTVVCTLNKSSSKDLFTGDYRFGRLGCTARYNFILKSGSLYIIDSDSMFKRNTPFAIKVYPVYDSTNESPLKGEFIKESK